MTSKQTPGPWAVSKSMPGVFGASRGNGLEPIGFVYRPSAADTSDVSLRADADARLIAAAPELLEALIESVSEMTALKESVGYRSNTLRCIAAARAAIAKATGAA